MHRLDTEAGRFLKAVAEFSVALQVPTSVGNFRMFSGFDIERWLAKTAIAVFEGQVCGIGRKTHDFPAAAAEALRTALQPPLGLWTPFRETSGDKAALSVSREASVQLLTSGPKVVAISATLGGIKMVLAFDQAPDLLEGFRQTHVYRPQYLNFFRGSDVRCVALLWPIHGGERVVWYSSDGPDAPIPGAAESGPMSGNPDG